MFVLTPNDGSDSEAYITEAASANLRVGQKDFRQMYDRRHPGPVSPRADYAVIGQGERNLGSMGALVDCVLATT
jgi:hypothetical protein